jgi:hypothetical protein
MKKRIIALFAIVLTVGLIGCPDTTPPPPFPGEGFFIQTSFLPLFPAIIEIAPGISTHWDWLSDVQGGDPPRGNTASFDNTTNLAGIGVSQDGRVPAKWLVTWNTAGPDPQCAGKQTGAQSDHPQRTVDILCFEVPAPGFFLAQGGTFIFTPDVLYTDNSSGSTGTVSGQGFTAQYGMPVVRYFDSGGNLVNQTSVTAIASDGTWVQAPLPDMSQITVGSYVGAIYNLDANGNLLFIGTTSVTVLDPPPPPPPDGGCGSVGGIALDCS